MTAAGAQLLPEAEGEFLQAKGCVYELSAEGGFVLLVLRGHVLPEAYEPRRVDLLLRLPPAFPNASPDMFWTFPDVKQRDGRWPRAAEVHESYNNRSWQRWSRHVNTGAWRPGIDGLHTYLAAIRRELEKGI